MTSSLDLYVLCAGGHGRVLADVLARAGRRVNGFVDANADLHGTKLLDIAVLGDVERILDFPPGRIALVNGLGNAPRTGDPGLAGRRALFARFKDKGYRFETVVSIDAVVSSHAELGEGAQIITGAIVHPGSRIGADVIVNTGARIDHDCRVGAHSHIAPGAVLCGDVTVGEDSHIGAGAVLVQGASVGNRVVVAAGAVVHGDVADGSTVKGKA